jgi:DNA helicase HerA-like ATPase
MYASRNHVLMIESNGVSFFAKTTARTALVPFGIKQQDRLSHMYAIGKTGVGKTTLLETLILQDITAGRGCALIDPHGDFVERIETLVPEPRRGDVVYLNIPDIEQPYSYNPLTRVSPEFRSLVASGLIDVFKKMWHDAWGCLPSATMRLIEVFHERRIFGSS